MAKSKSKSKSGKSGILWRVILLGLLAAIFLVSFIFSTQINYALGLTTVDIDSYSGTQAGEVAQYTSEDNSSVLTIHYIDVGQGDACVIELPDGKTMLIDGGKEKEKDKLLSYIDVTIDPNDIMLNAKKNDDYGFDYAILTHADEDHCGGIDDVLNLYGARNFYRPNELSSYKTYNDPGKSDLAIPYSSHSTLAYMKAIEAGYKSENIYINGDRRDEANSCYITADTDPSSSDYYEFVFYSPTETEYKDRNDYSPIIILTFQDKRIMFSGDAEKEAENTFVELASAKEGKYSIFTEDFTVDVVKLGHHGSRTSSNKDFLEALTREDYTQSVIAIVSCGFGNSYGHPHTETLDLLSEMGFSEDRILRTDTNGTIVLAVTAQEIFYGATALRMERPTVKIAGPVNLQWRELCITVWILIAVILIVQPFIKKNRRKIKKATGVDIAKYAPDTSKSLGKIDLTVDAMRENKGASKSTDSTVKKTSASDVFNKLSNVVNSTAKKSTAKKTASTKSSAAKKTGSSKSSAAKKTSTKSTTKKK